MLHPSSLGNPMFQWEIAVAISAWCRHGKPCFNPEKKVGVCFFSRPHICRGGCGWRMLPAMLSSVGRFSTLSITHRCLLLLAGVFPVGDAVWSDPISSQQAAGLGNTRYERVSFHVVSYSSTPCAAVEIYYLILLIINYLLFVHIIEYSYLK